MMESDRAHLVSVPITVTHAGDQHRDHRSNSGVGCADTGGPVAAGGFSRAPPLRETARRGDRLLLGEGHAPRRAGALGWPGQLASKFVEDSSAAAASGALSVAGDVVASCRRVGRAAQSMGTFDARAIQGQAAAPGSECARGGLVEAARDTAAVGAARTGRGAIRGRGDAPGATRGGASVGSSGDTHSWHDGGQRGGCEGDAPPLGAHDRGGRPRHRAGLGQTSRRGKHGIIEHFDFASRCGQAGRWEEEDDATLRKGDSREGGVEVRQAVDAQARLIARGGGENAPGGAWGSRANSVDRLEGTDARCNAAGEDAATPCKPEEAAAARQLKTVKYTSAIAAVAGLEAEEVLAASLGFPTSTGAASPRART